MNNLQKIAGAISGYDLSDHESTGARNDFYYELEDQSAKLDFIKEFSNTAEDIEPITYEEAFKVYCFLEDIDLNSGLKVLGTDQRFYQFKGLNPEVDPGCMREFWRGFILQYFQHPDFREELSEEDRVEIARACLSFNFQLSWNLEELINEWKVANTDAKDLKPSA